MTLINAKLYKSGTTAPLVGYINVTVNSQFYSTDKTYVMSPVKVLLVSGEATWDLEPSDVSKVAYKFSVYETALVVGDADVLMYSFEALVPFSATTINFNTLAPQLGIRYDLRDSSLLTLARYLVNADPFINFLGSKLWSNRGTWTPLSVYRRGDVVFRLGSSYQYTSEAQTSGDAPETTPLKWQILAQAGAGGGGGAASLPFGAMVLYPSASTLPLGYLLCNGANVSRVTYANLFTAIGTTYGVGNGTTTFTLPGSPVTGDSSFIIYTG